MEKAEHKSKVTLNGDSKMRIYYFFCNLILFLPSNIANKTPRFSAKWRGGGCLATLGRTICLHLFSLRERDIFCLELS